MMMLMKVFVMLLAQNSISMKSVQNLFLFVLNRDILNYFSILFFSKKYNNIQEDLYGITNNLIKKLQSHPLSTPSHLTPPPIYHSSHPLLVLTSQSFLDHSLMYPPCFLSALFIKNEFYLRM